MEFRPGLIERPGSSDGPQALEGLDAGRFEPLLQEINAGSVDSQVNRVYQQVDPAFAAMMKERHQRQFFKTKICKFWENNQCQRGSSCVYAHGAHELCEAPNLEKTALCFKVLKGGTCSNPDCKFAHSVVELRASVSKAPFSRIPRVGRAGRGLETPSRSERLEAQDSFDEVKQPDEMSDELGEPPWPRLAACPDAFGSPPGFWRQQSEDSARYSAVHSTSHYDSACSASQDPFTPESRGQRQGFGRQVSADQPAHSGFGRQVSAPAGLNLEAALFGDQTSDSPKKRSPAMTLSSPYVSRGANQFQPQLSASIAAELSKGNFARAKEQMLQMELLRLAPWSNSRASTRAPNSQSQGSTDGSGSDQPPYGNIMDAARMLNTVSNHSNDSVNGLGEQDPASPGQHTQMQMHVSSPFRRQVSAPTDLNLEAGLFGQQSFDPASSRSSGMTHTSPQALSGANQFQTQTSSSALAEPSKGNLSKAMQMELMRLAPWSGSRSESNRAQRATSAASAEQSTPFSGASASGKPSSGSMLDAAHMHSAASQRSSDNLPVLALQDGIDGLDADDGPATSSKSTGSQMSPSAGQMSQNQQVFNVQAGLAGMLVQGGMQVFQVMPAMQVLTPSEAEASPSAQFLAQELQRAMPECYED